MKERKKDFRSTIEPLLRRALRSSTYALTTEASRSSTLKKIAAQRITKSNIFWSYETLKRRGIDHDNRKEIYEEIQRMSLSDLRDFFDSSIKGNDYTALVIANKKDIDLKALSNLGEVRELDIDYLFNYSNTEVKQ